MTDKIVDSVRGWWPIAAGVIAASIAWGVLVARVESSVAVQARIEAKLDRLTESNAALGISLATQQALSLATADKLIDIRERLRLVESRQ